MNRKKMSAIAILILIAGFTAYYMLPVSYEFPELEDIEKIKVRVEQSIHQDSLQGQEFTVENHFGDIIEALGPNEGNSGYKRELGGELKIYTKAGDVIVVDYFLPGEKPGAFRIDDMYYRG
ncbi:hypothetical protein ACFL4W_04910, partial [Planctomycetota bacterium]